MLVQAELQAAYVLHSRPYRETSLLVDFLTAEHGRVSAVARGIKSSRKGRQNLLQPFGRLMISWRGKGNLKQLTAVEEQYSRLILHGDALFSGLYINELLVLLYKTGEYSEPLFNSYEKLLKRLATERVIEPALREFERQLLEQLGYGIPFPPANERSSQRLYYYGEDGVFAHAAPDQVSTPRCFTGQTLAAIVTGDLDKPEVRRAAKRLMRLAFTPLLGGRVLRSRELFNQQRNKDTFDER